MLSGNRNFEGRIHPDVKQNFLASPPLVVAYALAGTIDIDLANEPLGVGTDEKPVFLADLWPSDAEVAEAVRASITPADVQRALRQRLQRRRALAGGADHRTPSPTTGTPRRPT